MRTGFVGSELASSASDYSRQNNARVFQSVSSSMALENLICCLSILSDGEVFKSDLMTELRRF